MPLHTILCVSAADPWALPEPQPFTLTRVGDTDMYCTSVIKPGGRVWPFFLTRPAYQQLVNFVQAVRGPDPKVIDLYVLSPACSVAHTRTLLT